MRGLLERIEDLGYDRATRRRGHRARIVSSFIAQDLDELMEIEARGWVQGTRRIRGPEALLGFAGTPLPNTTPINAPTAVTGVAVETNLYTPATTANADWAIIPQGGVVRCPQMWLVDAAGIITSTGSGQTAAFTTRIGTSATPSSNQSMGATGAMALGSTISNAPWTYSSNMTITAMGTSGGAKATAQMTISQQAAGSSTSVVAAVSGNTTATVDWTQQQGYVISVTPSASGVSTQLTQFILIAVD